MFDDFLSKLRDLERNAQQLDGEHSVPFSELFNDEFMLRFTEFPSFESMIKESGFKVESSEDFAAIPDDVWDSFVSQRTRFESWDEMKSEAAKEWTRRKLGLE